MMVSIICRSATTSSVSVGCRSWIACAGGALLVMLLACGVWPTPVRGVDAESRARLAADVEFLSSDALRGRDTGSPEIDAAADYIAERFSSLGLNTRLFDGTPFQAFTALTEVVAGPDEENALRLAGGEGVPEDFPVGLSMRPLALGTSGRVEGPLVFAGYGISAPDEGYDDYADLDVQGSIVVILRGEPRRGQSSNPFSSRGPSRHAYFTTKVATAIEKGAAGLLLVNHAEATQQTIEQATRRLEAQQEQLAEIEQSLEELPEEAENSRQRLSEARRIAEEQRKALALELERAPEGLLGTNDAGQFDGEQQIPVASLGRRAFAELLDSAANAEAGQGDEAADSAPVDGTARTERPLALEELEAAIDQTLRPHSFVFSGITATLEASIESREVRAKNVIAELPGSGPLAHETIVIGAHYDHVGMGGSGSLAPGTVAVHNGADDNASGTAMMMELAHRMSHETPESRRRIVFMAFSAEERGLLGSKHYAREPRFALEDTVAMINLDMVGRLRDDPGLTIFGVGTSPRFEALIDQWNETHALPVHKDESGYGPSDHTSFYEKDIPVLFFFTGLHQDYHRPTDDFDKIDLDGMARITDMVAQAARHLATVPDRPTFQKTGPGGGVGRVSRSEEPRPYLGILMETSEDRVTVRQVVKDGPAAVAGLAPGDVILRVDDQSTGSIEAVQQAIGSKQPGDAVAIEVDRNGELMTVEVQLGRRE